MSGEAPADKRNPTQPRFLRQLRRDRWQEAGDRMTEDANDRMGNDLRQRARVRRSQGAAVAKSKHLVCGENWWNPHSLVAGSSGARYRIGPRAVESCSWKEWGRKCYPKRIGH